MELNELTTSIILYKYTVILNNNLKKVFKNDTTITITDCNYYGRFRIIINKITFIVWADMQDDTTIIFKIKRCMPALYGYYEPFIARSHIGIMAIISNIKNNNLFTSESQNMH